MTRQRWALILAALTAAIVAAGCGRGSDSASDAPAASTTKARPATAVKATAGYPSSIAVLAHSGATGENSDPDQPGVEVRTNAWATGTNAAVKSVYLRILAKNPVIRGHNVNLAQGGATVDDFLLEAEQAVKLDPKPELVLIQIIDNDMVCPAAASDYASFRSRFLSGLRTLARGAPDARLFVVSQFGSPTNGPKILNHAERMQVGGTGPCDFFDPQGRLVQTKLLRLERIIHGYELQLRSACRRVRHCRYDGGAFGRIVEQRDYWSDDLNHFSVMGHAKAAAVAWSALQRAGIVPRSD
jgi:hypothetical protein